MKREEFEIKKIGSQIELVNGEGNVVDYYDVNEKLPYGVYFDASDDGNGLVVVCMNEHYSVQMYNERRGNYDLIAECPFNTINTIFEGLSKAFPKSQMRVLSPKLTIYGKYPNEHGGITIGLDEEL